MQDEALAAAHRRIRELEELLTASRASSDDKATVAELLARVARLEAEKLEQHAALRAASTQAQRAVAAVVDRLQDTIDDLQDEFGIQRPRAARGASGSSSAARSPAAAATGSSTAGGAARQPAGKRPRLTLGGDASREPLTSTAGLLPPPSRAADDADKSAVRGGIPEARPTASAGTSSTSLTAASVSGVKRPRAEKGAKPSPTVPPLLQPLGGSRMSRRNAAIDDWYECMRKLAPVVEHCRLIECITVSGSSLRTSVFSHVVTEGSRRTTLGALPVHASATKEVHALLNAALEHLVKTLAAMAPETPESITSRDVVGCAWLGSRMELDLPGSAASQYSRVILTRLQGRDILLSARKATASGGGVGDVVDLAALEARITTTISRDDGGSAAGGAASGGGYEVDDKNPAQALADALIMLPSVSGASYLGLLRAITSHIDAFGQGDGGDEPMMSTGRSSGRSTVVAAAPQAVVTSASLLAKATSAVAGASSSSSSSSSSPATGVVTLPTGRALRIGVGRVDAAGKVVCGVHDSDAAPLAGSLVATLRSPVAVY